MEEEDVMASLMEDNNDVLAFFKRCIKCKNDLNPANFKSGRVCIECRRLQKQKWNKKHREKKQKTLVEKFLNCDTMAYYESEEHPAKKKACKNRQLCVHHSKPIDNGDTCVECNVLKALDRLNSTQLCAVHTMPMPCDRCKHIKNHARKKAHEEIQKEFLEFAAQAQAEKRRKQLQYFRAYYRTNKNK